MARRLSLTIIALIALAAGGSASGSPLSGHLNGPSGEQTARVHKNQQARHRKRHRRKLVCRKIGRTQRLDIRIDGQADHAYYYVPPHPAPGLVVADHGYGVTADVWLPYTKQVGKSTGTAVLFPDYRGLIPQPTQQQPWAARGAPISGGAVDTVALTKAALAACPQRGPVALLGGSMGGGISGLAIASRPRRANGKPLFEYWVDVDGVTDQRQQWFESYFAAHLPPPYASTYAAQGLDDLEREMGGSYPERPEVYEQRSVINHAADMKAAGLRGAVIMHAIVDDEVPGNQAIEEAMVLENAGIPTEGDAFSTHPPNDTNGRTLDGDLLAPIVPGYSSPFAGHIAFSIAFAALHRAGELVRGAQVNNGRFDLHDGATGATAGL